MILPDREIKKLLAKKLIVIDPAPTADAYSSTSVDLSLDPLLRVFRAVGPGVIIDPSMPGYKVRAMLDGLTDPVMITAQGWDFAPGVLVLGWTKERNVRQSWIDCCAGLQSAQATGPNLAYEMDVLPQNVEESAAI